MWCSTRCLKLGSKSISSCMLVDYLLRRVYCHPFSIQRHGRGQHQHHGNSFFDFEVGCEPVLRVQGVSGGVLNRWHDHLFLSSSLPLIPPHWSVGNWHHSRYGSHLHYCCHYFLVEWYCLTDWIRIQHPSIRCLPIQASYVLLPV